MTFFINRTTPNGDLTLLSGELDEVNYAKTGANLAVTTAKEFDEVTLGYVVDGVVRKDYDNGAVGVAGVLNEADYYDEAIFIVPGTYSWTCPFGVTRVSAVCIGGGGSGGIPGSNSTAVATGGGGGALAYYNNIPVVPGTTYTVVVGAGGAGVSTSLDGVFGNPGEDSWFISETTVCARGGHRGGISGPSRTNANWIGWGGGRGGLGGIDVTTINEPKGGGGGGAGGYAATNGFPNDGDGGTGGNGTGSGTPASPAGVGRGGGAAGGSAEYGTFNSNGNACGAGGGGGGTDIYGIGANGLRQANVFWDQNAPGGGGGSGGTAGGTADTGFAYPNRSGAGGLYGGGSGAATGVGQTGFPTISTGKGGDGAVRIIWSTTGLPREFPRAYRPAGFRPAEGYWFVFVTQQTYTSDWRTQLVQRVQFTWSTELARQQFFQLGSYITLSATRGTTLINTKDTAWANLIDSLGTVNYTAEHFFTSGNVVIAERFSPGSYTANYYKAWGEKFDSNSSIVITALFDDTAVGSIGGDTFVTLDIGHQVAYYNSLSPVTGEYPTTTVLQMLSPPN